MSRKGDADEIRHAYLLAIASLARVGKMLRTTEAGNYLWANRHKTAVTGMKATLEILRQDVPDYKD